MPKRKSYFMINKHLRTMTCAQILQNIQYQTQGFPSVCPSSSVTLRGPPLNSATGWTGELWSNRILLDIGILRGQHFLFGKKKIFSKISDFLGKKVIFFLKIFDHFGISGFSYEFFEFFCVFFLPFLLLLLFLFPPIFTTHLICLLFLLF